jgi:hypothetical protein
MPEQDHGQVVGTEVEARGAGRGAWTYDAQPVGLEPWADRGSLRSGLFLVFQNLTNLTASCWSAVSRGVLHDRSPSTGCFRAKCIPNA